MKILEKNLNQIIFLKADFEMKNSVLSGFEVIFSKRDRFLAEFFSSGQFSILKKINSSNLEYQLSPTTCNFHNVFPYNHVQLQPTMSSSTR